MQAPTNIKQIRAFFGMVRYYHNMWPCCSHILAPLTELTGKKTFVWEDKHQQAFEQMKALIATDALLAYPNHNKPFDIETDASKYQLGAIIKQDNRPIACYTRKLNSVQKNYTTIKKELLSIVKTLKEFRSMLLGALITIYTDHKNSTHKRSSFSIQCIL
jgi:RNase H-like domain found in reverse transcriptase